MTMHPQALTSALEYEPVMPDGTEERFGGYGIMGLPFASGHILAFRRFTASSIGAPYSAVWHRNPAGQWTFYSDTDPQYACSRFFGRAIDRSVETDIEVTWTGPYSLRISIPQGGIVWQVTARDTWVTKAFNIMGDMLPQQAWRNSVFLNLMGPLARFALGLGKVNLTGKVPNGQEFIANPYYLWSVEKSTAWWNGAELGPMGPVYPQARLGDFFLPQRGILALGRAYFSPTNIIHPTYATDSITLESPSAILL